jgi:hypothetical protein
MSIEILRRAIRGTIIAAGEAGYADARGGLLFNKRSPDRSPAIVVRAACVADVQETVRYAARHGMTVSPRGSGHNFSGIALQDGIVLDLGALDRVAIDAEAKIAEVEPAAKNGVLAAALTAHGLAFPVGHCHTVSMSGYLLGGGFGWNSGAWGLACHNVEAVEVVMADGRLIRASADEHPDVFWAVRGGGPEFFGVVVRYRLRLHDLPKAIRTSLFFYPIERVREVEAWVTAAMAAAPATVEFATQMQSAPPFVPATGKVVVGIPTVFAETEEEARAVLGRIAALAPAEALAVEEVLPMSFESLYEATASCFYAGERYAVDSQWSGDAGDPVRGARRGDLGGAVGEGLRGRGGAAAGGGGGGAAGRGVLDGGAGVRGGLRDLGRAGTGRGQRRLAARHRRPAGPGDARALPRRGRPRAAGLARGELRAGGARTAPGAAGAARSARHLRPRWGAAGPTRRVISGRSRPGVGTASP